MINISGHLREERKITGYYDQDVPLIVIVVGSRSFRHRITSAIVKMADWITK